MEWAEVLKDGIEFIGMEVVIGHFGQESLMVVRWILWPVMFLVWLKMLK